MDYLSLFQLISVYGVLFFVQIPSMQIFLSVGMAAHPQFFEFKVTDELINTAIIMSVIYGILLILTSLGKTMRSKKRES
jgi:hypothetical protein